ncbi:hypothetical protein BamIOP4010DRAFT_1309 [Burkholderia ambifaria IOP40-10]|uniref:Uncharacterized protein n=1 Tax=Burkholderia ambifaria IOP40-10 TaxID=396596 RepID=B1FBA0_9BURK|nr:hypothetical protein BamIOP4010DRAFT_1309 [Burkholderia ambifaria IOP40-10]
MVVRHFVPWGFMSNASGCTPSPARADLLVQPQPSSKPASSQIPAHRVAALRRGSRRPYQGKCVIASGNPSTSLIRLLFIAQLRIIAHRQPSHHSLRLHRLKLDYLGMPIGFPFRHACGMVGYRTLLSVASEMVNERGNRVQCIVRHVNFELSACPRDVNARDLHDHE